MSVYDQGALLKENKALKKARRALEAQIAFKESENQRLKYALAGERSLWKSRDDGWDAGRGPALHRMEVLDDIIRDGDKLRPATLADCNRFRYMLERAERFLAHSGQMPLFRDDAGRISDPGNRCKLYLRHALERAERFLAHSGQMPLFRDDAGRISDPGNRCKLYLRHALLMALIHKKDNPTQEVLVAFFGIDQTAVSRYLPVMDRMLAEILPTADKISEEIAGAKTKEEFKRIVPGPDGGDIFIDGTHCPVQRPSKKTLRRMAYSGKKKKFTNNTNVYTNRDGVVIGISKCTVGSVGDITLLKERPMPFGRWEEAMHEADRPEGDRNRLHCDRGYQGIATHLPGTVPMIPYKKTGKTPPDAGAKKAQQPDQLHQGAGGAQHLQAQALLPHHRSLRRDRGPVQQGV